MVEPMDVDTSFEYHSDKRNEEEDKLSVHRPQLRSKSADAEAGENEEVKDDPDPMDTFNYPSHFPLFHI